MSTDRSDRSRFFPAIEKKHGEPVAHWLALLAEHETSTYLQKIALLREDYGFSQAHANALVMYAKGSTSSKKYSDVDSYFATLSEPALGTVRRIVTVILDAYDEAELVMAWNKPMIKMGATYIFGVSVAQRHILLLPFGPSIIDEFAEELAPYVTNKKTIQVPLSWDIDDALLLRIIEKVVSLS